MNDLDRETEAQIEKLVDDFRNKITRIVLKNSSKLLKEQAKFFKDEMKMSSSPVRKSQVSSKPVVPVVVSKSRKKRDYDTDDDSD
jgi:hypothetical protein